MASTGQNDVSTMESNLRRKVPVGAALLIKWVRYTPYTEKYAATSCFSRLRLHFYFSITRLQGVSSSMPGFPLLVASSAGLEVRKQPAVSRVFGWCPCGRSLCFVWGWLHWVLVIPEAAVSTQTG